MTDQNLVLPGTAAAVSYNPWIVLFNRSTELSQGNMERDSILQEDSHKLQTWDKFNLQICRGAVCCLNFKNDAPAPFQCRYK